MAGIVNLEARIDNLPDGAREIFQRIFHVRTSVGCLKPPESMRAWLTEQFGSVEVVRSQQIVKVTNTITWDGALFNELRARRPIEARSDQSVVDAVMAQAGDRFCHPLDSTPEDVFGRVQGRHAITASNVAKYDALHGVVIFERHNPFEFTADEVLDYVNTALQWGQRAHAHDPEAKYFFFMWNCLWKAGASVVHGHSQVVVTQDMHYAKIEELRRDSLAYTREHGRNYFEDLYDVHAALDLGFRWRGIRILACLTPTKERETWLIANAMREGLKRALYRVLQAFLVQFDVTSFNVALYTPPTADVEEEWGHFPTIFRVVDRGDPMKRTADIGAMELYAAPVISADPFSVADQLRKAFQADVT